MSMEIFKLSFLRVFTFQLITFFVLFFAQCVLVVLCFGVLFGVYFSYILAFAVLLSVFLSAALSVGKKIIFNQEHMAIGVYSLGYFGIVRKVVLLRNVTKFRENTFSICIDSENELGEIDRVYIPKIVLKEAQVESVCAILDKFRKES